MDKKSPRPAETEKHFMGGTLYWDAPKAPLGHCCGEGQQVTPSEKVPVWTSHVVPVLFPSSRATGLG